ncbi:MAG: HD-GYP domain-containing protein [Alcanivoracaceae bacterium]
MAVKVEKVATPDLQIGMYVSQLDRPWIETPFPLQGFHIRSQDDIERLRVWCKFVHIDIRRSTVNPALAPHALARPAVRPQSEAQEQVRGNLGKFTPKRYAASQPLKREVATAAPYHREISRAMLHLIGQARESKTLSLPVAKKAAAVVVQSVVRNPDAMVWLARLKDKDSYSYSHSVRSSILAAVFGRHIGLPEDVLHNLATGSLLMDIGLARLPREVVTRPETVLSRDQQSELRQHVLHSLDILEACDGINDQILGVVQYHHERHDGSGYPHGLSGNQIPLLARIAGIVDTYDAITSPRPFAEPVTSTEAVSVLYDQRDKGFQSALVEQFIQAIGVYPTGTLVELSSREVGVVIAQNPTRRLRPQVMVLLDHDKRHLSMPQVVDLLQVERDDFGQPLTIAGCLKAGAYNVDLARVQVNAA